MPRRARYTLALAVAGSSSMQAPGPRSAVCRGTPLPAAREALRTTPPPAPEHSWQPLSFLCCF